VAKTPSATRPDGHGLRVVVLRATFNAGIVAGLTQGAVQALREMGTAAGSITTVDVPGAFELPLAARAAAHSGRFDAIVALGVVIRGETDHYEHIAREAAAGLATVARETATPIGFGVLTVKKAKQAAERSRAGAGNKGGEAARAALAMVHVVRALKDQRG
jgi:6,7-dimethyl-8-ribityllumazine synthase